MNGGNNLRTVTWWFPTCPTSEAQFCHRLPGTSFGLSTPSACLCPLPAITPELWLLRTWIAISQYCQPLAWHWVMLNTKWKNYMKLYFLTSRSAKSAPHSSSTSKFPLSLSLELKDKLLYPSPTPPTCTGNMGELCSKPFVPCVGSD